MSAPTTPVLDTFNRRNGGLGSNWVMMPGTPDAVVPKIVDHQVAGGNGSGAAWKQAFNRDQELHLVIPPITEGFQVFTGCRLGSGTQKWRGYWSGYFSYSPGGGGAVTIFRGNNYPDEFPLADVLIDFDPARWWFRCVGSSLEQWALRGSVWVKVAQASDKTLTNGGRIGFSIEGSSRIDNFGGGNTAASKPWWRWW